MKTQGRENVTYGFSNPSDGFHRVAIQDGAKLSVNENSGKESFMIPMKVDEGSADDGCTVNHFINTRDENGQPYKNAEQNIADLLVNVGLADAFSKKFPGNISELDPKVIEALILKLPGNFLVVETKTTKDNKGNDRCNVRGVFKPTYKPEEKGGKKAATKAAEPATGSGKDDMNW
jgi:hypothetical protein